MLLALFLGHALADFPLQGVFLARAKNHNTAIDRIPWYICLWIHAIIHAGAVAFVTGNLGLAEFIVHTLIDILKNVGAIDFTQDQILHLLCKVAWVAVTAILL